MKRSSLVISSVVTLTLAGVPLMAQSDTYTTSKKGQTPVTSCDQIDSNWKGKVMQRSAETLSVPGGSGGLTVADLHNSAIYVTSGSGSSYEITVCKVAAGDSAGEASRILSGIEAEARGRRLNVSGPDRGKWVAHLIVRAPANAVMDLATTNGPISFYEVSGRINARATNGPISLTRSSGNIDASQHSPVSCDCDGARTTTLEGKQQRFEFGSTAPVIRMSTVNGPVSIKAEGVAF